MFRTENDRSFTSLQSKEDAALLRVRLRKSNEKTCLLSDMTYDLGTDPPVTLYIRGPIRAR